MFSYEVFNLQWVSNHMKYQSYNIRYGWKKLNSAIILNKLPLKTQLSTISGSSSSQIHVSNDVFIEMFQIRNVNSVALVCDVLIAILIAKGRQHFFVHWTAVPFKTGASKHCCLSSISVTLLARYLVELLSSSVYWDVRLRQREGGICNPPVYYKWKRADFRDFQ